MADNVFYKAIEAHTTWKIRLRRHLDGTSDESLDPDHVCKDDQCALGQWIYGEGQNYKSLDTYEELRNTHADFHRCAADIIRKTDNGQKEEAESLFGEEYGVLSRRITKLLVHMNAALREKQSA